MVCFCPSMYSYGLNSSREERENSAPKKCDLTGRSVVYILHPLRRRGQDHKLQPHFAPSRHKGTDDLAPDGTREGEKIVKEVKAYVRHHRDHKSKGTTNPRRSTSIFVLLNFPSPPQWVATEKFPPRNIFRSVTSIFYLLYFHHRALSKNKKIDYVFVLLFSFSPIYIVFINKGLSGNKQHVQYSALPAGVTLSYRAQLIPSNKTDLITDQKTEKNIDASCLLYTVWTTCWYLTQIIQLTGL